MSECVGSEGTESLAVFRALAEFIEAGMPCALCTVEHAAGSTPREAGARMVVPADGRPVGTVGGGALESAVVDRALEWIASGTTGTVDLALDAAKEGGLPAQCGGAVRVRIETIAPPRRIVIFGAGHVGAATARVARAAGFLPVAIDDRDDLLDPLRRDGIATIRAPLDDAAAAAAVRPSDALVVVTRGHAFDLDVVRQVLRAPCAYIGMIGSRRKVATTREALLSAGFSETDFARLRAPIGLDIGAETPGELGVAIVGQIVATLHGR
ncbi:MAG: XdhC family protein [Myxococcota bacterium]|nr:XdhC family protein [Myxococcota bacterium]